ncbi:MAG TPA: FAD-binding oxidoreductase [Caulobacteraceae bacterium]|jgi:FAD/FMN-containing dehydrogenase|nr:FAD-binding oxidoreductase [Caulobacteraceae bacterium]
MEARLDDLRAAFSGRLLTGPDETAPFLTDWRGVWRGEAFAVVQPDTAQDVAAVVAWCARTGTPVVPQGGNTGLSGGATPDATGRAVVLSLTRLDRVRSVDPLNNTMTVEAGCILQRVQEAAAEAGRFFPLSLAAEGSCTIGGNLATNAGGTAVLRYGNARELCLGLEVVTPQGELWDGLRGLRKDNTGYDLRDLFIGAEGTLGVITAAVMKLHPAPAARVAAFAAVATPADALKLLALAQARLGAALTAFELVSDTCLGLVLKHFPGLRPPLEAPSPWYVLVEVTDLIEEARGAAALEGLLEAGFEAELVSDAAVASSIAQSQALWALRENISEAQGHEGKTVKHDISVPIPRIGGFIAEAEAALAAQFPDNRRVVFGHLGDGNLHFNLSPPEGDDGQRMVGQQEAINRLVHDIVDRYDGSISAEHGLGVLRREEAARYKSPVEIGLMRAVKQALDPQGLMNPGKVLS